jgi:predicted CXXCH cytochrome family protein
VNRRAYIGALILLAGSAFAVEHPVPITADSDCAECHEARTRAKYVHSAIAGGCSSCHEVKVAGETVSVTLIQPKQELCFTCHEQQTGQAIHSPYAAGECTTCHDPHASGYPRQLKAGVNETCLRCHLEGALPPDMENSPARINLDQAHVVGHPYYRHPVAGHPDPLNPTRQMTCLSCHVPHAGSQLKLIAAAKKQSPDLLNNEGHPTDDICLQCHVQINKDTQESGRKHSYKVTGPASLLEPKESPRRTAK